jgi:ATP-dependent Clp protease, protease subunit
VFNPSQRHQFQARATANKRAEIQFYGDVGPSEWGMIDEKAFADALKGMGDVEVIDLRINSAGGSAFSGVAIYNQLMRHPARIEVTIDGLAASIASVVAMAGDSVTMGAGTQMMIHDASVFSWGNAAELRRNADLLDSISGDLAAIYARRTGRPVGELRDLMKAETWFTAEEAFKAGLADTVLEDATAQAHLEPVEAARFRHPPKALLTPRQTVDLAVAKSRIASIAQRTGHRAKAGA